MTTRYNWNNVRTLLTDGFSVDELRHISFDESDLRPVYNQLAQETGKAKIVDLLMEYAEQHMLIETLLKKAKEVNLERFKEHQPYYCDDETESINDEESFLKFFGLTSIKDATAIIVPRFPTESLTDKLKEIAQKISTESTIPQMEEIAKKLQEIATTTSSDLFTSYVRSFNNLRQFLEALKSEIKQIANCDLSENENTTKILSDIHDRALAQVDVEAYVSIRDAFSKYSKYSPPPEIKWDDKFLQFFNNHPQKVAKDFRLLIAVGLFSNDFTMSEKIKRPSSFDKRLPFSFLKKNGESDNTLGWFNRESGETEKHRPTLDKDNKPEADYALIARIKISPQDQYLMIVGGITADGTEKIGKYLGEKWSDIYEKEILPKAKEVIINEFAVLFQVPVGESLEREIECVRVDIIP